MRLYPKCRVRAPEGVRYWTASLNPFAPNPVSSLVERFDDTGQRIWDEGRYFLSKRDAWAAVAEARRKLRKHLKKKKTK